MIGHELGGRYQVIERIGGGGMALVYRAHDILLNRNVAIKVLRNQFVHDEEFIRRFRREAQSAASLSHPNVVSIYDVGQEDEIHYIVMEYIEGKNLNEIIKERAPLQVDEAVRVASQICDALDHAHQNQIIHRDIKPHNILIGRNGRVKVTDFGIARAVTSTTITQTGSVLGSVHYFSPEHAKGVSTGEKSDLYSLGIVLYQMLTGSLPFLGESPISVALKHLQEEFEEPRSLNSLIPQSVENVILRSMRKNPEERYQSAKQMLQDLETCLLPERRSEAKLLFNDEEDEDRTRIIPAIKPIQRGNNSRNSGEDRLSRRDEDPDSTPATKGKKPWVRPTLWIGVTLLLLLAMASVVWYVKSQLVVPEVPVPYVVGKEIEQAKAEIEAAGLVVAPLEYDYSPNFEENFVIEQSRDKDTKVKKGASLILTVNTAKPLTKMPPVTGKSYDEAVKALMAVGVAQVQIKSDPIFDENMEAGKVVRSDPDEGSEFDLETASIILYVSKGVEGTVMPELIGRTESEAKALLEERKLVLGEVKESTSFSVEAGKVTKTWAFEAGATVPPGTEITIFISTGYPPEALNYTFNVPVAPAQDGKKSKIQIEFIDARNNGEKQDWGTRTIGKSQILSVNLVLAPNKDGSVIVTRDGVLLDTYAVSYFDAKNGNVQEPEPPVEATPQPTQTPVEPTASAEPTVEPEILPESSNGNNNGTTDQTGFLTNSSKNSESLSNTSNNSSNKNNEKGNNKVKDNSKDSSNK